MLEIQKTNIEKKNLKLEILLNNMSLLKKQYILIKQYVTIRKKLFELGHFPINLIIIYEVNGILPK